MNVEEYISESNQKLKGENFYKKLNESPTRKQWHWLQMMSEHHNFIFYQRYINQTFQEG